MTSLVRTFAFVALLLANALAWAHCAAQESEPVRVTSDVQYEYLDRWDVDRLNQILQTDMPRFAGLSETYSPASNAVRLYRVTYSSVIPERGNKPITATGLIAVPEGPGRPSRWFRTSTGPCTENRKCPPFPDQSPETQLMIAQFAGQGYVLVGADYFGMGDSDEPEGYLVKGSHQQATFDMLAAAGPSLII